MVYTAEEARQKECPMLQKKCIAENCMVWMYHFVRGTHPEGWKWNGFPAPPPPPPDIPTGKGYCGLVKY